MYFDASQYPHTWPVELWPALREALDGEDVVSVARASGGAADLQEALPDGIDGLGELSREAYGVLLVRAGS